MSSPGQIKEATLRQAGFGDSDISAWQDRTRTQLGSAGFSPLEVDNYFGAQEPASGPWAKLFSGDVKGFFTTELPQGSGPNEVSVNLSSPSKSNLGPVLEPLRKAATAGFENSVIGLAARGRLPDTELPKDASLTERMVAQGGQLAGDFPAMIAGSAVGSEFGAVAGSEVPVVGNLTGAVMGGGGGALALPEAMRTAMVDAYKNGSAKTPSEYLSRVWHVTEDAAKQFIVGATTMGAGKSVEPFLPATRPLIAQGTKLATEAITAATASKSVQGELPNASDFEDAAVLIFGLHAAGYGAGKLRTIYAKTGVPPIQVLNDAQHDPNLKEDLAATNVAVPERYQTPPESTGNVDKSTENVDFSAQKVPETGLPQPTEIVKKPTDLLKFLAKRGGLNAEQGDYSGHLEAMDAQRTFIPGAGMLVRKSGGLSLDYAREAAEQAGYGPFGDGDIQGFIEALDSSLRGGQEFSVNDFEQARSWRAQEAARQAGPAPDASETQADQIAALRERATALGVQHSEDWSADDLQAAVTEREAMRAENLSDTDHEATLNLAELDMDRYIAKQYPQLVGALKADGYESDIPFGPEPKEARGVAQASRGHDAGPRGSASHADLSAGSAGSDRGTAEPSGQLNIPGSEPSARQLAASRESAGHGRAVAGKDQKAADEGLFAAKKSRDAGLFGPETGSLIIAPPKIERTADEKAVLDRIVEKPETKRALSLEQLYTDTIDDLNTVKVMEQVLAGKKLPTQESPYQMMRLFRGSAGKVEQFLERAPFNFKTLKNVGPSLKDILAPVKHDLDGLRAYIVARRAVELEDRGVTTGVPLDAAQKVIADGDHKYSEITQELHDYQRHLLDYLRDSGVLSKEAYAKIIASNEEYVPFYRLMEPDEARGGPSARGKVKNPVKQIKGSERQIIDPLESIVRNTDLYVKLAEKNRALTTLVDMAAKYDIGGEYLERVKAPIAPITLSDEEAAKFLKEYGITPSEESDFTVFRPKPFQPSRDEIAVFRDGKKEVYRAQRDLADAVEHMDPEILPWFVRLLSLPAKALRAGATLLPDFIGRNLIRDQLTANSLSNYKFVPFYDTLRSVGSILKKDDKYQAWLKGGGANGAMVSLDRRYMEQNIFGLAKQTSFMKHVVNAVTSPLEMLRIASEIAENTTRLGAFKRAFNQTGDEFASAFEAREVTLDFARIGAKMRAINAVTAFSNAGLQGIDRTVRAFKENPFGTTAKTVAAITVPSVLLWWANHDDPRWAGIPDWEKDLFWIVMTKDHIYRIPKPFELGIVFGSLPERVLQAFHDHDPSGFEKWSSSFIGGLTPNYIPTFLLPPFEAFANRSTFTGNKLVPPSMEGILPQYQYTDYTSETAKLIGKYLAPLPVVGKSQFASPILLENYIRAWSGGLGMFALQASDYSLRKAGIVEPDIGPMKTLSDIPFVKAFVVRYPSASDQRVENFYDRFEQSQQVINTISALAHRGEPQAALEEMMVEQNSGLLVNLKGIQGGLSKISAEIRQINKDPSMKPEEKRQMIDSLYETMIEGANLGNQYIDQLDAAMAQAHAMRPETGATVH